MTVNISPSAFSLAQPFAAEAASAVEAVVEAGAKRLIAEPWRVARIVRGAEAMTFQELAAEAARRRALPPNPDFNRALAFAQLSRALKSPAFAASFASSAATCAKAPRASR
jgi:hypothetical protein